MKTLRRTAAAALPVALLIVAAAALAGWGLRRTREGPREIRFIFPPSAPTTTAIADLRACTTIEEAMLFKVMGVVRNLSPEPLRYPTVQVVFLDGQGSVLDRSQGCIVPEVLESQHSGRFVLATQPNRNIAAISVALSDPEGAPLLASYSLRDPAQGFVEP